VSAAAERDEDILYVCYDNEIYGNTGGQRSSATPAGASTSTTPAGKHHAKKDILSIMASHRIPYAASISLAHVDDMMRKLRHALDTRGFRFLHILSPCPTGWKSEPADGIALIRQAVESGLYPVIEIVDGVEYTINIEPTFSIDALRAFIEGQGRFTKSKIAAEDVEIAVRRQWEVLRRQTVA
jgi:pyruvate ferredoxin oxidoreductase beta subunit/2-oxoisovalerate ferredoxin oxidoreductase beta subunit